MTSEPTPPNTASLDERLSFFHADMSEFRRLWNNSLSILTSSAMLTAGVECAMEESKCGVRSEVKVELLLSAQRDAIFLILD